MYKQGKFHLKIGVLYVIEEGFKLSDITSISENEDLFI